VGSSVGDLAGAAGGVLSAVVGIMSAYGDGVVMRA